MTLNEKSLRKWEKSTFTPLTAEQRKAILARFSTEPGDGQVWTEQDIAECIRKTTAARRPYRA